MLGGGIGANGDLLLEPIGDLLASWLPYPPRLEVSSLGEAAVLSGALAVGLRTALDEVFVNRARMHAPDRSLRYAGGTSETRTLAAASTASAAASSSRLRAAAPSANASGDECELDRERGAVRGLEQAGDALEVGEREADPVSDEDERREHGGARELSASRLGERDDDAAEPGAGPPPHAARRAGG